MVVVGGTIVTVVRLVLVSVALDLMIGLVLVGRLTVFEVLASAKLESAIRRSAEISMRDRIAKERKN